MGLSSLFLHVRSFRECSENFDSQNFFSFKNSSSSVEDAANIYCSTGQLTDVYKNVKEYYQTKTGSKLRNNKNVIEQLNNDANLIGAHSKNKDDQNDNIHAVKCDRMAASVKNLTKQVLKNKINNKKQEATLAREKEVGFGMNDNRPKSTGKELRFLQKRKKLLENQISKINANDDEQTQKEEIKLKQLRDQHSSVDKQIAVLNDPGRFA